MRETWCNSCNSASATAATAPQQLQQRLCVRRGAVLPQLQLPGATAATGPLRQAWCSAAPAPASSSMCQHTSASSCIRQHTFLRAYCGRRVGSSPSYFIFLRERERERERDSASGVSGCIRRCLNCLHSFADVSNKASSCIPRWKYQYDLN